MSHGAVTLPTTESIVSAVENLRRHRDGLVAEAARSQRVMDAIEAWSGVGVALAPPPPEDHLLDLGGVPRAKVDQMHGELLARLERMEGLIHSLGFPASVTSAEVSPAPATAVSTIPSMTPVDQPRRKRGRPKKVRKDPSPPFTVETAEGQSRQVEPVHVAPASGYEAEEGFAPDDGAEQDMAEDVVDFRAPVVDVAFPASPETPSALSEGPAPQVSADISDEKRREPSNEIEKAIIYTLSSAAIPKSVEDIWNSSAIFRKKMNDLLVGTEHTGKTRVEIVREYLTSGCGGLVKNYEGLFILKKFVEPVA